MTDMAAREMTFEEWARRLAGLSADEIAAALRGAEARGYRRGRDSLSAATNHFEVAYRYAVNASRPGADAADLLASAKIFADIAYREWSEDSRTGAAE